MRLVCRGKTRREAVPELCVLIVLKCSHTLNCRRVDEGPDNVRNCGSS